VPTAVLMSRNWLFVAMLATMLIGPPLATADPSSKNKLTPEDHVRAVLENKDAHSLWLLLARAGHARMSVDSVMMNVNIHTARRLIERWNKTADYKATAQRNLSNLHLPKDRSAENNKIISKFKKAFPDAIVIETHFYHLLSTSNSKITKRLAKRMDAVFRLYESLFDFKEKLSYKCVIKFWKDQRQYMAKGAPAGSVAYYSPSTKELVGYNTRAMPDTKHMNFYHAMYHEGWHQFFDFYIPGAPRWFDEGFAEFFEQTQVGRNRASMRRNEYGAKRAAYYLKRNQLIPLRDLFHLNHEEFMANADVAYAQSYSFITFMMNFHHGDKRLERKVHSFYRDYFWRLREGIDPVQAVDDVFGNIKLEMLEVLWKKSVRRQR